MEVQDNRRFEIARRNKRRVLEDRDYKLMTIMFSIVSYSAFTNFVIGAAHTFGANRSIIIATPGLVLGVLYALAAHQVWFKSKPSWWLIVLPAVISIAMTAASMLGGAFAPIPLLLNAALIALIPLRTNVHKNLAAIS